MGEIFVSMAGTEQGDLLALLLTLMSALAHAIFGAVNKGGVDPYLNRGAVNIAYSIMLAPFALFMFPLDSFYLVPALALSFVLHLLYEWFQAAAYSKGTFTLVYPIARGVGPLVTGFLAILVFGEVLEAQQWVGLVLLSAAIFSLAGVNLVETELDRATKRNLSMAIVLAVVTGIFVALYTTVDAYGVRLPENPFTFIVWFFFLGGFGFPFVAWHRYRNMENKPSLQPLAVRGIFGAFVAMISFGSILLATRIGNVSEVAALRETSIIFATGIGVLFFHEKVDAKRLCIIFLIAAGAIMIELH